MMQPTMQSPNAVTTVKSAARPSSCPAPPKALGAPPQLTSRRAVGAAARIASAAPRRWRPSIRVLKAAAETSETAAATATAAAASKGAESPKDAGKEEDRVYAQLTEEVIKHGFWVQVIEIIITQLSLGQTSCGAVKGRSMPA